MLRSLIAEARHSGLTAEMQNERKRLGCLITQWRKSVGQILATVETLLTVIQRLREENAPLRDENLELRGRLAESMRDRRGRRRRGTTGTTIMRKEVRW